MIAEVAINLRILFHSWCQKLQELELRNTWNCSYQLPISSSRSFTNCRTFSTNLAANSKWLMTHSMNCQENTVFFLLKNVQQVNKVYKTLVKMLFLEWWFKNKNSVIVIAFILFTRYCTWTIMLDNLFVLSHALNKNKFLSYIQNKWMKTAIN